MIGAPAVASAEPDADGATTASVDASPDVTDSGSTTPTTGATDGDTSATPTTVSAADSAADSAAAAERDAVEGVASTFGSGREPGDPVTTGTVEPTESSQPEPTVTSTGSDGATGTDSGAVSADGDAAGSSSAPADDGSGPVSGSSGTSGATGSTSTTTGTPAAAPVSDAAAATNVAPAAAPVEVAPAPDVTPVPYLTLWASRVLAPIADIIQAVRCLIAKVVVAPLANLQRDLAQLFAIAGIGPAMDSLARVGVKLPASVRGALEAMFTRGAPTAPPGTARLTRPATPASIGASAALGEDRRAPVAEPVARAAGAPGPHSFLDQVGEKVLEIPTLLGLAVAALPGLGGLLMLTAAGTELGYRQAKARLAVSMQQGIARFVPVEPPDTGRGGTLVFLHPRAARRHASDVTSALDEAA
ncbi:hypothetical protein ACWDTP_20925 [Mycobacterium sp. NPDC003449]